MENTDIEKVNELYQFLTGEKIPEGMQIVKNHRPKMSGKQAFTIIWFLQEHLRVLPDNFERCDVCEEIYDSYSEGGRKHNQFRCGSCY